MINIDTLQQFISLAIRSTEISKSFNVGQALVARWIKFRQPSDVLRKSEDDTEIIQILREMQKFHPNVLFCHAFDHLREKGVKENQVRLRLILKNLKHYQPVKMDVVRRRSFRSRSSNSVWYLDSSCKLVGHEFVASGSIDGHRRRVI